MPIVINWNPVHDMFALDETISQMLAWTSDLIQIRKAEMRSAWTPTADMYETEDTLVIHAELAGVDKNSLEIILQDNYLVLRGNRPVSPHMQTAKIHRIERMYGHFQRVFWIPESVDSHHVTASYEQGVLKITLVKLNQPVSDRVKIPITFE